MISDHRSIDVSAMKVVAALLRDPNRIHFDVASTVAAGLGDRPIGQGPITAAIAYDAAIRYAGSGQVVSASVRFLDNIFEGDELTAEATPHPDGPDGPGGHAHVFVRLHVAGRDVAQGEVVVATGSDPS